MTAASPLVHPHAQQSSNGVVHNVNGYPNSIPRPSNDESKIYTIAYTIIDVFVFLAVSIGYILQVSLSR